MVERRREASATAVVFRRVEVGNEEVDEVAGVEPTTTDLPLVLPSVHVHLAMVESKEECDELKYLN